MIFHIVGCVLVAALVINAEGPPIENVFEECKKEHNLSEENLKPTFEEINPAHYCFFQCMGEKMKYVEGNKILIDKLEEQLKAELKSEESKKTLNSVLKKCSDEVANTDGKEKCWAAAKFNFCARETIMKTEPKQ